MISRRLVSGIAATLLGAAGLATAASAMNSDSKPAVPHGTTAPNTATPDATISVADGQVDDSAPDSTDQAQGGKSDQSDSGN